MRAPAAAAPPAVRAQLVTESQCQATIVAAARTAGWHVLAIRPALNRQGRWGTPIQGDPGYPDLTLCHRVGGLLFVELKRHPNRLEPAQAGWGKALTLAGAEWRLVYVPDEQDAFCQELVDRAWGKSPTETNGRLP